MIGQMQFRCSTMPIAFDVTGTNPSSFGYRFSAIEIVPEAAAHVHTCVPRGGTHSSHQRTAVRARAQAVIAADIRHQMGMREEQS